MCVPVSVISVFQSKVFKSSSQSPRSVFPGSSVQPLDADRDNVTPGYNGITVVGGRLSFPLFLGFK